MVSALDAGRHEVQFDGDKLNSSSLRPSCKVRLVGQYIYAVNIGMLCYAVLCYAILCYAMLYYAMLCYAMRGYVTYIASYATYATYLRLG